MDPSPQRVAAREWALLAAVVGLAVGVRALRWSTTSVLFNDGPRFLAQASALASGDLAAALAEPYHPLYAAATAALHALLGGDGSPAAWERAAVAVSVLAGSAAVVGIWLFLRRAFDPTIAAGGAVLLAVHAFAVPFSADVQSEGLYLGLFAFGLAAGGAALARFGPAAAGACGLLAGLAYLVRPEGLGLAAAVGLVGGVTWLRGRLPTRRALPWAAALALGVLVGAAPYVVAIRASTGAWAVSLKKDEAVLVEAERAVGARAAPRAPGAEVRRARTAEERSRERAEKASRRELGPAALRLLDTAFTGFSPELALLALLGVWLLRGAPGTRGQLTLALALVYSALLGVLLLRYGYVSRRHTLPPMLPLLGYAAHGLALGLRGLAGRLPGSRALAPAVALAWGLLVLVPAQLIRHLGPHRSSALAERRAAEWIREQGLSPQPVAATKRRVAYYAGAPWVPLRESQPTPEVLASLRGGGVRYLVVDEAVYDAGGALAAVHRAEAYGHSAWVLELSGAREGPAAAREVPAPAMGEGG